MNSVGTQETKRTVFSNGLTLVSERTKGLSGLSIGFWVKAGSVNELAREAGISHFLEHMAFKGTESRTAAEIAKSIDRVGGEFNAFTSRENTCFHVLLLNQNLKLGIDILTDLLLHSQMDAEELERERKVIMQEIAMVEDTPEEYCYDLFFEKVFGKVGHGSQLGRSILGTENSVRKMRRIDILKYYRYYYSPEHVVISVSGDVSHKSIVKLLAPLKKKLWPGRSSKKDPKRKTLKIKPKFREDFSWKIKPTEQVHMVLGMEGPKANSRDHYAATLLNVYLGSGMSSLLFQEVREKLGLAYSVYSGLSPYEMTGVFSVYAAVSPSSVLQCLKAVEECLIQTKNTLLDEKTLQEVKNNLKGTLLLSEDNVESRMIHLGHQEIYFGNFESMKETAALIDKVTVQDIKRAAQRMIKMHSRSLTLLGPKPLPSQRKKIEAWYGKKIKWI